MRRGQPQLANRVRCAAGLSSLVPPDAHLPAAAGCWGSISGVLLRHVKGFAARYLIPATTAEVHAAEVVPAKPAADPNGTASFHLLALLLPGRGCCRGRSGRSARRNSTLVGSDALTGAPQAGRGGWLHGSRPGPDPVAA